MTSAERRERAATPRIGFRIPGSRKRIRQPLYDLPSRRLPPCAADGLVGPNGETRRRDPPSTHASRLPVTRDGPQPARNRPATRSTAAPACLAAEHTPLPQPHAVPNAPSGRAARTTDTTATRRRRQHDHAALASAEYPPSRHRHRRPRLRARQRRPRHVTIEIIGNGDVDTRVFEGSDPMARAGDFLCRRTAGRLGADRRTHLPGLPAAAAGPAPPTDRQRR